MSELRAAAEARWGAERLEALQPGLETAAEAVWQLAEATLGPLEVEPDFIGGIELPGEA